MCLSNRDEDATSRADTLLQFGRDFDKVAAKLKIKTKEQCRHYHFRQSKRIKQFLQDPEAPEDAVDDKNFNELRCVVSGT